MLGACGPPLSEFVGKVVILSAFVVGKRHNAMVLGILSVVQEVEYLPVCFAVTVDLSVAPGLTIDISVV